MPALLTRRALCLRAAGAALAALAAPSLNPRTGGGPPSALAASENATRAADAYRAMQRHFYVEKDLLYRELAPQEPGDTSYAYFWTFEEAAKATLFMYGMPGAASTYSAAIQDRLVGRERYWDGGAYRRAYKSDVDTGERYYDDNDWAGSNLLQHALMTTGPFAGLALERAKSVLRYIVETGWHGFPNVAPGGMFWVNSVSNRDRGTGATAGAAKLAAHLFHATGRTDVVTLAWAKQMYEWVKGNLLSPENSLYWDKILPDGSIDTTQWIYNQGIMIGASVLLYHAASAVRDPRLGDPGSYLAHAEYLAVRTLDVFGTDPYYSGGRDAYSGRAIFNAIFCRNLLMLYAVNKNPLYVEKMQAYADDAWNDSSAHDFGSGLFKYDPDSDSAWLLDQAGMVQLYACLAWDPANYGKLT